MAKKGVPKTEEHKRKLREAKLRNPVRFWLGKKNPMSQECKDKISKTTKGKKKSPMSDIHRKNIGKAGKGRTPWNKGKKLPQMSGKNHPFWIKDRSKLAKRQERNDTAYREWRQKVKNRDGWKCRIANQDCIDKLIAHHILGWTEYPELRYEVNNGITLCQFHHPRKRNDEKRLSPYFQKLVIIKV